MTPENHNHMPSAQAENTIPVQTAEGESGIREEICREADALGMDPERILSHRDRLRSVWNNSGESSNHFKIVDTCRVENGRLFPLGRLSEVLGSGRGAELRGYGAFVPSAGAASRYMAALEPLRSALESGSLEKAEIVWNHLSGYHPVMPAELGRAFSGKRPGRLQASEAGKLLNIFKRPKALLPCVPGGQSFLQQKLREHENFSCLDAQFYITPPGFKERFLRHLEDRSNAGIYCYEQGTSCSTLRFLPNGRLFRDRSGRPSRVPAGHGSLLHLFPELRRKHPEIKALFIRNIDNICSVNRESGELSRHFLSVHQTILEIIQSIRKGLDADRHLWLSGVPQEEQVLLNLVGLRKMDREQAGFIGQLTRPREKLLWEILFRVFLTPFWCRGEGTAEDLLRLFNRPFNLMGQVRNRGKDKGGSPVVIKTSEGNVGICLERPHATKTDQKEILDCPEKSTHFNPVFVAAELSEYHNFADHKTPFWLSADKTWQGSQVIYYETVLYELLGNTAEANCLFTEVPDFIFNPRKTLGDALEELSL